MTITRIALFIALSLPAAFAQNVQPVKDVDNAARNAVWGSCTPIVQTGQQTTFNGDNCTMGGVNGAAYPGAVVPNGKILVIEEASATCAKSSTNAFATVQLHPANGLGRRVFEMAIQGTENQRQYYSGTTNGRMYIKGTNVRGNLVLADPAVMNTSCQIYFFGHLVDAQ
jgi:hypothetical protein